MKKETQHQTLRSEQPEPEKLITIKKAASALGVEYRQLLAGVASGKIRYYQIAKGRRLVRLSEVLSSMLHVSTSA